MVDIEIQDLKSEIEREKRKKLAESENKKLDEGDAGDKPLTNELDHPTIMVGSDTVVSNSDTPSKTPPSDSSNSVEPEKQETTKAIIKVEKPDFEESADNFEEKKAELPVDLRDDTIVVKQEPIEAEDLDKSQPMEIDEVKESKENDSEKSLDDTPGSEKENIAVTPTTTTTTNSSDSPTDDVKKTSEDNGMPSNSVEIKESEESSNPETTTPVPATHDDDNLVKTKEVSPPLAPTQDVLPEKEKICSEEDESKGSSSMEMNEVQVEIKNELKITIKLMHHTEKMNRVEVQVKGSPKFSMPEPPSVVQSLIPPVAAEKDKEDPPIKLPTFPKFDPFLNTDSSNGDAALSSLLNQMNPIRWVSLYDFEIFFNKHTVCM